jgi:hypothetical protein
MPAKSVPTVAMAVEPGGPAMVIIPGPTKRSFQNKLDDPSEYVFVAEGTRLPVTEMDGPEIPATVSR